ncbi:MAG TPA: alpha/beta hydrolase [Anaerolineales bacterium]|jgi:pimeloyl-ACP methyl ester carboxylesterase
MKYPHYSMSKTERLSRGAKILFRTMRPRYDDLLLPETRRTAEGFEYQVYQPQGKVIRTVMLVNGMTIRGEDDPRMVMFARSCAEAGLRVAIPLLPGLKEFIVEKGDMRRLESVARVLSRNNEERIGMIGFSTGGSYSLLLAAHPLLGAKIGPLVLFSPVYDVRDVAERLHTPIDPHPETAKEWDQFYWGQYVIAFRNRKKLRLATAVREALSILLGDWAEYSLEVKRAFFENHILGLQLIGHPDLFNEGQNLDLLSARGHLAEVKSPVFILHDASDQVVPPDHSRRMYAELAKRGAGFRQEVLVTPWLSHVVMNTTGNPAELFQIISYVSELFRSTV